MGKAIEKVFKNGTAQIKTKLVTKSGNQIPYLLEAFSFVDNDRNYLMGLGIDITSQQITERKLTKAVALKEHFEQEKNIAVDQLETKKRELITFAIESGKTNKIIKSTINQLTILIENHAQNKLSQELIALRKNLETQIKTQDNWEIFKLRFIDVHKEFFNKITKKYPGLTKAELKFCAYLRIHLSSD